MKRYTAAFFKYAVAAAFTGLMALSIFKFTGNADKKINYAKTAHGKLSRIFGNSIFDKTFGSAGFNKHMLHHLEPFISYTRLDELEAFLKETPLGKSLKEQRASYFRVFKKLLNK